MLSKYIRSILICGVLCGTLSSCAQTPIDLQGYIESELAAGKKHIVIPPGRYRVAPVKASPRVEEKTHLYLRDLSDVTIDAEGVEMVCTQTTRAVWIKYCTNVTIRGLTIDYDPLPYTQGRITAVYEDEYAHEVELFEGYPSAEKAIGFKYEIFRPDTRTLRYGEYHDVSVEALTPRKLRVVKGEWQRDKKGGEQVGDLIVIGYENTPGGSEPHAVVSENCSNLRLEKITLYASNCFGFFETHCDRTVYQACRIDRRPPESDPVDRESPRLRSLNADAYHSKHALHGPQLLGCTAKFQGDDAVNINGSYHFVTGAKKNILTVLAYREMDIQKGDVVEVVAPDGRFEGHATVRSVNYDGLTTREDINIVSEYDILEQIRNLLKKRYLIELDQTLALVPGSVINSRDRVGNGLRVENCYFGYNRSRGILIKAGEGEVVGNTIERCGMTAILIAPEYRWLEAGYVRNLRVADNVIIGSGHSAIAVHGFGNGGAHDNIDFIGNRLETDSSPAVVISGATNVKLTGNTLNGKALDRDAVLSK